MEKNIRNIAVYGAGGLGREVENMIIRLNKINERWNFVGFFDDNIPENVPINNWGMTLGGFNKANTWNSELDLVICIGNPKVLYNLIQSLTNSKLSFPNIISPDFVIEDENTFSMGKGNIIKSNCRVTTGVSIGNFNIFNGTITLGHDVSVGNFNVFMPGVRISGESVIGERNLFGSMSFVKQNTTIGHDVILSPLSPLLTDPKDGRTYIGNPARIFKF